MRHWGFDSVATLWELGFWSVHSSFGLVEFVAGRCRRLRHGVLRTVRLAAAPYARNPKQSWGFMAGFSKGLGFRVAGAVLGSDFRFCVLIPLI